jgi:hypothetical protein
MNLLKFQEIAGVRSKPLFHVAKVTAVTLHIAASMFVAQATENALPKIVRLEGGITPNPVMTSGSKASNQVTLTWQAFGHQVPRDSNSIYQVFKCPALKDTNNTWTAVGNVTNATTLSAASSEDIAFFTVSQNPPPIYAGADKCGLCHYDTHQNWLTSRHAQAFQTLKDAHQDQNASCLPCHTVGYGSPNGFKDEATTPQFAGVQCENCHGPAGGHASSPLNEFDQVDQTKIPLQTYSAELCGGCHTDVHHPNYEEWAVSVHATTPVAEEEFSDPVNGPGRMLTCGACHSAATRVTLLHGVEQFPDPGDFQANITTNDMPSTVEAASTTITCVACHNPHLETGYEPQLRFPRSSMMPYSYSTSTNFAANFNADVQTCGQCHNMRGAAWTDTSRPPHHSPQYNILIGNGGYEAGSTNAPQSAHMAIPDQCIQCHVHPGVPDNITMETPAFLGHTFEPTLQACAPCHDEVGAGLIKDAVQANTKQQIAEIKGLLDQWALTKAPADLSQKYGVLAWEYSNIGQLSTPTPQVPNGPNSTEQKSIPDGIKQARYNLYLIDNDHSYGVHNGNYSRFLLSVAREQVNATLQAQ